jgi:hypothetical protein
MFLYIYRGRKGGGIDALTGDDSPYVCKNVCIYEGGGEREGLCTAMCVGLGVAASTKFIHGGITRTHPQYISFISCPLFCLHVFNDR